MALFPFVLLATLLFEDYDLDGDDETSYSGLAQEYEIAVTDVTNGLAWARRVVARQAQGDR